MMNEDRKQKKEGLFHPSGITTFCRLVSVL
jgi:hypothetical protein